MLSRKPSGVTNPRTRSVWSTSASSTSISPPVDAGRRRSAGACRGRVGGGSSAAGWAGFGIDDTSMSVILTRPHGEQRLGDAEPGERHAERRAAHRVEPEAHQEVGRRRVTGVLAAGAELDRRLDGAGRLAGDPHELADALLVEHRERVGGQDAVGEVGGQQLRLDVVAAERVRHLGEVVGAEREEVGVLGEFAGGERGARRLDHGPDRHDGRTCSSGWPDLVEHVAHPAAGDPQLLGFDHERDHDLDVRPLARANRLAAAVHRARTCIS